MAISQYVGSFNVRTGAGAQSITGVGFQPKVIIFYGNTVVSGSAGSMQPGDSWMCGIDDGVTPKAYSHTFEVLGDTIGPGSNRSGFGTANNASIIAVAPSFVNVVRRLGYITSLDADGFSLNFSINLSGSVNVDGDVINFIALGGADLNYKIGEFYSVHDAGSEAVTGVGFTPSALFLLNAVVFHTATFGNGYQSFLGFTDSDLASVSITSATVDTDPIVGHRSQTSDLTMIDSGGTVIKKGNIASFDLDGYTVNWSTDTQDASFFYLALGGKLAAKVGAGTEALTNITKSYGGGWSFTPKALFAASYSDNHSTSPGLHNRLSFGAADGTNAAGGLGVGYSGLSGTSSEHRYITNTALLPLGIDNGDGTATLKGLASFSTFDVDGFTLSWANTDSVAREFIYFAFGDAPAPPACEFTLSPASVTRGPAPFTVHVELTSNLPGCTWTAVPNDDWLDIDIPSGTGSETFLVSVERYFGDSRRVGTITIAGLTFTVIQEADLFGWKLYMFGLKYRAEERS